MPFVKEKPTIWKAARQGLVEEVKRFYSTGVGIDARAKGGVTPLHEAAKAGQLDVIKWLLDSGANINARTDVQPGDPGAESALYLAVCARKTESVKLLLERGANPNLKSSDGSSALAEAASNGDLELVKILIEHRAKVNPGGDIGPLYSALLTRHLEIAKFLVVSGALVNIKTFDSRGTMLMTMASARWLDGVSFLLEKGLNVNDQDEQGLTVLHYAVLAFHGRTTTYKRNERGERVIICDNPEDAIPVIKRLLEVGGDPTIKNQSGLSAIDFAKKMRAQPLLDLLLPHNKT